MAAKSTLDNVITLAKRRGFVFQAGEIYGGTRSAWDYGPLGVELKENIRNEWWKTFVRGREDMVGLDSSIILPRAVWIRTVVKSPRMVWLILTAPNAAPKVSGPSRRTSPV